MAIETDSYCPQPLVDSLGFVPYSGSHTECCYWRCTVRHTETEGSYIHPLMPMDSSITCTHNDSMGLA